MRKRVTGAGGAGSHEHARSVITRFVSPCQLYMELNPVSKISREGAQQRHGGLKQQQVRWWHRIPWPLLACRGRRCG